MLRVEEALEATVRALQLGDDAPAGRERYGDLLDRLRVSQHFLVPDSVADQLSERMPAVDLLTVSFPFPCNYLQIDRVSYPKVDQLGFFFLQGVGLMGLDRSTPTVPGIYSAIMVLFPDRNLSTTPNMVACLTVWADGEVTLSTMADGDAEAPSHTREILKSEIARALNVMSATTEGVLTQYVPSTLRRKAKAKHKHKHPLIQYKLLKLDLSKLEVRPVPGGGHHASPRLHLRRGHWRAYKSGHRKWINPMWVGDKEKGMVVKSYSIAATRNP